MNKQYKKDVDSFNERLDVNLYDLHQKLKTKTYTHSTYKHFVVTDPKKRDIHKAAVSDRIIHHLFYSALYPYFDKQFIYDSYLCRENKGTHKAMDRFKYFAGIVSKNNTRTCWVLKYDVRKFFASIDHATLKTILEKHIQNRDTLGILFGVIDSFHTESTYAVGLPLGNLTSQLLVNVYMNEFDQYIKHVLKVKYYIRYAGDFVILSYGKNYLESILLSIDLFLVGKLKLTLQPNKVSIKTYASGVDFLGWVHFPHHRVLRMATKKRMMRKLESGPGEQVVSSYKGYAFAWECVQITK